MTQKTRFAILRSGLRNLFALGSLVLLSLPATAAGPWDNLLECGVPDCIGKWCSDDYCPKKEPCVRVRFCFGCDDYCGKKEPSVCVPLCFGCDDYCKKCPPKVCGRSFSHFLRWGSPGQPCGSVACDTSPRDAQATAPIGSKE